MHRAHPLHVDEAGAQLRVPVVLWGQQARGFVLLQVLVEEALVVPPSPNSIFCVLHHPAQTGSGQFVHLGHAAPVEAGCVIEVPLSYSGGTLGLSACLTGFVLLGDDLPGADGCHQGINDLHPDVCQELHVDVHAVQIIHLVLELPLDVGAEDVHAPPGELLPPGAILHRDDKQLVLRGQLKVGGLLRIVCEQVEIHLVPSKEVLVGRAHEPFYELDISKRHGKEKNGERLLLLKNDSCSSSFSLSFSICCSFLQC